MRFVIFILTGWLALNVAVAALLTVAGEIRARRRGPRVRTVMSRGLHREVY